MNSPRNSEASAPVVDLLPVRLQRLSEDATIPSYAYEADAGLDLSSSVDITLEPFERKLVPTGLAIAIPEGYAGFVLPRSGLAFREGLSMANTPGLIDAHYRGELKVVAVNLDASRPIHLTKGERIAQLVILPVPPIQIEVVDALDSTDRGAGGFGSSGT